MTANFVSIVWGCLACLNLFATASLTCFVLINSLGELVTELSNCHALRMKLPFVF